LVIAKLIVLPAKLIEPAVMVSQPVTDVEVTVGVKSGVDVSVSVGRGVSVPVGVREGINVGVLLGKGVIVTTAPTPVTVGVAEGAVAVAAGVSEGTVVTAEVGKGEVGVFGALGVISSRSKKPKIVLALDEEIVRELIGTRFTIGR